MVEIIVKYNYDDVPYDMHTGLRCEEIVRCRDCDYCTEEGIYTPQYYCNNMHWHYLSWQGTSTEPDGFCKWGKRREV